MRRIAQLLADLLASYGFEAMVDARLTSRSRTTYVVPLAARRDGHLILADGDPGALVIDEVEVHRLLMAATDLGCRTGLYIHSAPLTRAAIDAAQDRIAFWSRDDIIPLLGAARWAHAMGEPLPHLLAPLASFSVPTLPGTLEEIETATVEVAAEPEPIDLTGIELPEAAPVFRSDVAEARPTITLAEPDMLADEAFLDLGGADLGDHADEPADGTLPDPMPEPTVASIEPVVTEISVPDAVAAPILEADPAEFMTPAVTDLMPPAFQDRAAPVTPVAPTVTPTVAPRVAPTPHVPPTAMSALVKAANAEAPLFALPQPFRDPEPDVPGTPIATPDGSRGLLPPRVTLQQAKSNVAERLYDIEEAELILQPVHLFDYAVELLREGSLNIDTRSGRLQVNGTDRRVMTTDSAMSDPNLPHRVYATPDLTLMDKVCRVSPERARQVASEWLTDKHGKTIQVNGAGADDSFDLLEKRKIGPTSAQVQLTYLGLWHRPFWRLWGNNGHIDVDAVEAMILDAEVKGPSADVMMVE